MGGTRQFVQRAQGFDTTASATVLAPSPLLTITIEAGADGPEIHLHAGGQGFWLAQLMAELGVHVTLCGTFGGESGSVVRGLIEGSAVAVRAVESAGANGAYIHDRRDGERVPVADMTAEPLSRHEVDDLYSTAFVAGLEAAVCVLGGPPGSETLPADVYRRLSADLVTNDKTVVVDLSGEPLDAALAGGVTVLKVSHEELLAEGRSASDRAEDLIATMQELVGAGANHVVVSRGAQPTLAMLDGRVLELHPPEVEEFDARGAGDSLTAGIASALAWGDGLEAAVRLGVAAGGLNVTRRGLGTGNREAIERLAGHVHVSEL